MKKAPFLVAMLVLLPILANALPIKNIQDTTSCVNNNCVSYVNLSTLGLTTNQLNLVKGLNLSSYLPKLDGIVSINYKFENNQLIIYGTVSKTVYWTMNLGTYITLDPYWNYTTNDIFIPNNASVVIALPFHENTGTTAFDKSGLKNNLTDASMNWTTGVYDTAIFYNTNAGTFTPTNFMNTSTFTLTMWIKTAQKTTGIIYDRGSGNCEDVGFQVGLGVVGAGMFNAKCGNGCWNKSDTAINDSAWHFVAVSFNGTHNQFYINNTSTSIKTDGLSPASFNAVRTVVRMGNCNPANQYVGYVDEFKLFNTTLTLDQIQQEFNNSINKTIDHSVFYTTALLLNGTSANITWNNATPLNLTAYTNMTGLNVSLWANGTLLNSSTTSCNYSSNLSVGFWNITSSFVNASMNTFITWWANITYIAPTPNTTTTTLCYNIPETAISSLSCFDTTTLQQNWTIGNETCVAYKRCSNGCDGVLNDCKPLPITTNFIFLIIVIIILIILYKVSRW